MLCNYLWTFFFLLQALLCGVQALAIPAIMLSLAMLLKPVNISLRDWGKHKWGEFFVACFLLLLVSIIAMRGFSADFSNGFMLPLQSWQTYLASQFYGLITYYLRCFLLPFGLSILPPYSIAGGFVYPVAILGVLVLLLGAYGIYKFRKLPLAAAGLAIALLSYLPFIFFRQNEIIADWRFYIPMAGLCLFIATVLKPWWIDWQSNKKIKVCGLLLLVLFSTLSILRSIDFRSDVTLFKSAIRVNEKDTSAEGMLALAW